MAEVNKIMSRVLGNYRILAEIGSGGFGRVYRGNHIFLTERIVAIKVLHTHLSSPEERDRFLQEAHFLEQLKHAYILHVFDLGIDDGFPYLVTEYAPNGSLRNRIKQNALNPLQPQEVIDILTQIGQALHYAHQQNVVHRDLKPENILFNAKGEPLLADFGISTTLSTASVKAVTLIGTPPYMAPEQFQGIISKESDQYALGCIAYELVTGNAPFTAPDFFSMGFKHMTATPVPPGQLNPTLPVYIEQAILKALAKQRSDRHPDVLAFISALRAPTSFSAEMSTLQQAFLPHKAMPHFLAETTITQTGDSPTIAQQTRVLSPSTSDQDNTLVASHSGLQTPHEQGFVTPLPPVMQAPLVKQEPVTPLPFGWKTSSSGQEPMIPFHPIQGVVPFDRRKFKSKRTLFIFAAICILLVASVISALVFVLPSLSSQIGFIQPTNPTSAGPTIPIQKTGKPTQVLTLTATSVPRLSPTSDPIVGTTPDPAVTHNPTPAPTVTHNPTPDPIPDPKPYETLVVPFTSAAGVATTYSYSGTVTITVRGTGQASQTQHSDAFYEFTNNYGTPTPPYRPPCWVLNINGQSTNNFVKTPAYSPSHVYTFSITAPGGNLNFSVCDGDHSDNTGQYSITVTQV